MINFEAFSHISYGLYLISSGDKNRGNAYVANTFSQVTSEPARFAICCNKNNFTAEFIQKHKAFAVSILSQNTSIETFGKFGYKSGKDFDKMKDTQLKYGETGVPIVLNDSMAYVECKVVQTVDVGTHWMFIGELLAAELIDGTQEPITYAYYKKVKKGLAPKNAPTYIDPSRYETKSTHSDLKKYKCPACGYIYDEHDESSKFVDLPDDWVCPICGTEKSDFVEIY